MSQLEFRDPVPVNYESLMNVRNSRKLPLTRCYFNLAHVLPARKFANGVQVFADGEPNILQRFLLGGSLRPAAGKPRARYGKPFF